MSDGGPLRWVSGLPMWEAGTHYQGEVFDFLGQVDAIKADLTRQITDGAFRPGVIAEHTPSGLTEGSVEDWRLLSQAQAKALGLPQQAPFELYLGLALSPKYAAAYDAGDLRFTSPDIRGSVLGGEPWLDETGAPWSFFIGELSAVATPHNKRQVAAPHLRGIQMADKRKVKMADGAMVEIEAEAPLPDGAMEMSEGEVMDITSLAAEVRALAELVKSLATAAAPAAAPAPAPMMDPAPMPAAAPAPATIPVQMSDVNRMFAALQEADQAITTRQLGSMTREKLAQALMSDPTTTRALIAAAPVSGVQMTGRQAQPGAKPATDPNDAAWEWATNPERIKELRAKFSDPDTGRLLPEKRKAAIKAFEAERRNVTFTSNASRRGVQ